MVIDTGLSTTSTNPVQNRAVTLALGSLAPLADLEDAVALLDAARATLSSSTAYTAALTELQTALTAYVQSAVQAADWMDRAAIRAVADDQVGQRISEHDASAAAHPDLREIAENAVTLAAFEAHTQGGFDPVTGVNSALHISSADRLNWDAAKIAADEHFAEAYFSVHHITAADREDWNTASDALLKHVVDDDVHVTASLKAAWASAAAGLTAHTADVVAGNEAPHVAYEDRVAWNRAVTDLTSHVADFVLQTAPHLRAGERTAWNNAATMLSTHVADYVLATAVHLRDGERASWTEAADAIRSHVGTVAGNPHHVTAENLAGGAAYTKTAADAKITQEKDALIESASNTVKAFLAGSVRYMGVIDGGLADLRTEAPSPAHGDAYIVTSEPGNSYIDVDGNTVYQAMLYVATVDSETSAQDWVPFGRPFTVDMSKLMTKEAAQQYVAALINTHNADSNAHSALFEAIRESYAAAAGALAGRATSLEASKLDKSEFLAHVNRMDNPHAVTAADLDTLSRYEIEQLISGAQAAVVAAAKAKIGAMVASTFKWRGTVSDVYTLRDKSLLPTAAGATAHGSGDTTDYSAGDSHNPELGDSWTVEGSAQMYVYTGRPVNVTRGTDTVPVTAAGWYPAGLSAVGDIASGVVEPVGDIHPYMRLATLALGDTAEVAATRVPNIAALVSASQAATQPAVGSRYVVPLSGTNYAVFRFDGYSPSSDPSDAPTSTDPTDWGWTLVFASAAVPGVDATALYSVQTPKAGDTVWVVPVDGETGDLAGARKFVFRGRSAGVTSFTPATSGKPTLAELESLGWHVDELTTADLADWGWDDVGNVLNTSEVLQQAIAQATAIVSQHDSDENAHASIQAAISAYTNLKVHFPGDANDVPSAAGYWTVGVNAVLTKAAEKYAGLATTRQIAALVALVDSLYAAYANKQSKLVEGLAIKLTDLDASNQPVGAGATPAKTQISWDPMAILKKTAGGAVDESYGLNFSDGELFSTYQMKYQVTPLTDVDATKAGTLKTALDDLISALSTGSAQSIARARAALATAYNDLEAQGTWKVTLGEAYATLRWLANYTAGVATWDAIQVALDGKQDKLVAGKGLQFRQVVDDADEIDGVVTATATHWEITTLPEEEQTLELTSLRLMGDDGKWYDLRVNEDGDLTTTEVVS